MARLKSSKNKKTGRSLLGTTANNGRGPNVLEMELDQGDEDEDEEEYMLPSSSSSSSSSQSSKVSSSFKNNSGKSNRNLKKECSASKDDNDENSESNSSSSSSSSVKMLKLFFFLFVLIGVGGLFVTQLDRPCLVLVFSGLSTTIRGIDDDGDGTGKQPLMVMRRKLKLASRQLFGLSTFAVDTVVRKPPKQDFHGQTAGGSFGGINNVAHPGGAQAAARGEGIAYADIQIPVSNVGHAIPSVNRPNFVNLWGHYVHDEHRSPYASHLYAASVEELATRQTAYEQKMKKVREEWGAWSFKDPLTMTTDSTKNNKNNDNDKDYRSVADFTGVDYKDLAKSAFPLDSWQADEVYVKEFLKEAKALVARVKEGIYTEYGWPTKGKTFTAPELEKHQEVWKIHIWEDADCWEGDWKNETTRVAKQCTRDATTGLASIHKNSWTSFTTKLLHTMMTNDEFYAVLGGHSAAAGHGNEFQQNRIIHGFHHLMEPVFDKLGAKLVSRNMGMGGVGTLQFSLAGGDLYGEADIIEWDSGMTEGRVGGAVDLWNKQAVLSGERVPLIMTYQGQIRNLMAETQNTAMIGNYMEINAKVGEAIMAPKTTFDNAASKPYASRWFDPSGNKEAKYNAICWEPRSDFTPTTKQDAHPGSQVGWHPGNKQHTWSGRKLALIVLEGLEQALQVWEQGIQHIPSSDTDSSVVNDKEKTGGDDEKKESDSDSATTGGCPLDTKYWHVGDMYREIRQNLRTHINTPIKEVKEDGTEGEEETLRSNCENLIPWLPRICRVQMHGFGMWNPRAHVDYDFLNLLHEAPNGYKPDFLTKNIYDGFDLLPLQQQLSDKDIDVHAIAIATTNPPPDLDHSWIEEEATDTDAGKTTNLTDTAAAAAAKPPTRRWLHRASQDAFRKGAELFQGSSTSSLSSSSSSSMVGTTSQALNMNMSTNSHRNDNDENNHRLVSTTSSKSKSTEETRPQRQLIRKNRLLPEDATAEAADASKSDTNAAAAATKKTYGENDIVPGRGWVLHGWAPVGGFCDGSPQSECNRGDPATCLMSGSNDKHYDVIGDSLSGWLVFTVPKVVEGIILIRMEWWCGSNKGTELTKDWTEVNDGKTFDTTPFSEEMPSQRRLRDHADVFDDDNDDDTHEDNDANDSSTRKLGGKMTQESHIPLDLQFDYVINNGEIKSMDRDTFIKHSAEYVKNVAVFPLLNDETMAQQQREDRKNQNGQDESEEYEGDPIEVAVRFRSKLSPKQTYCISHVFYA